MCTVSIVPTENGFQVMHARDEQRTRAAEVRPAWRDLSNGQRACWPTDPDGGGTWVGARQDGLILGILNLNLSDEERLAIAEDLPKATISRGLLIPELIEYESVEAIIEAAMDQDRISFAGMNPFRLVIAGRASGTPESGWVYGAIRFDGVQVSIDTKLASIQSPVCWASSGLGDGLVQCRLPLFEEIVGGDPSPVSQRAFHWFQWSDRLELSPMMSRLDARTSSVTTIGVAEQKTPTVLYDPIAIGDAKCDPVGAGLLR